LQHFFCVAALTASFFDGYNKFNADFIRACRCINKKTQVRSDKINLVNQLQKEEAVMGGSASLNMNLNANIDLNDMADKIASAINSLDKDKFRDRNDTWLFFEGNNATQQICGSLPRYDKNYSSSKMEINAKKSSWIENDEARSVLVQNGKAGDVLRVYDNPDGKTDDDWAVITLKKDVAYLVIGTFEQTYENELYKIDFHRKNGLDGKTSCFKNY
jgi:hypothetical protein